MNKEEEDEEDQTMTGQVQAQARQPGKKERLETTPELADQQGQETAGFKQTY